MPSYPSAIFAPRAKENKTGIVYDPTQKTIGYAEDVVYLDNEVVSLETILGLSPQWASASVAERIKGIRSLSDATEGILTIKGSFVGVNTPVPTSSLHITGDANADAILKLTDSEYLGHTFWLYPRALEVGGFGLFDQTASAYRWIVSATGNFCLGTEIATAKLDIVSDILRLRISKTPASAGAAGNAGDICWDANFIYICVDTNSWTRVAIAAW